MQGFFMEKKAPIWLKSKSYLHVTAQIDVQKRQHEIVSKITNPQFVASYAFYPLLHTNLLDRKYKRDSSGTTRAHCHNEQGVFKKTAKVRPLHYATHMDAIIFTYYADVLQTLYESQLQKDPFLHSSVTAYRRIPTDDGSNKGTIHFAKEVFEEIKAQVNNNGECSVLTFDIKSFFPSLNHDHLKRAWAKLLGVSRLPNDHFNLFKASTKFSYIYLDDLRVSKKSNKGRKAGFDEKRLAMIRNKKGINSFFESSSEFRKALRTGELALYKYPFRNKAGEPVGIPQGLPISAVLANLYLLEFDRTIIDAIVKTLGGFYRRYSDDIVVLCRPTDQDRIESEIVNNLKLYDLEISSNKTEKFFFQKNNAKGIKLTKVSSTNNTVQSPLSYLGFEFDGRKMLIKSSNLSKFYRRMVSSVKKKCLRAKKIAEAQNQNPVVFRRQLYHLYTSKQPQNKVIRKNWKKIEKKENGEFRLVTIRKEKVLRSNYLTYVRRASEIMNEEGINSQIKKHQRVFNRAIMKHLKK
ncbi:MAG: hypothetical protein EOP04_08120 [Proteobacteria bacterium]|nr:MAG: hypothetical protein EOP04_08120 [Pseudomonadota bacterium]